MRKKVKITSLPKAAKGGDSGMYRAFMPYQGASFGAFYEPTSKVKKTLGPTDRSLANIEAEKGETIVTDLNQLGIPEFYNIGGKRHSEGGTPLHVPENSFIFSDTRSMKIKDEEILKNFGKGGSKSYTPAELSKKYDINKYLEVLTNPDSSKMEIDTAELMIKNYNNKLGELALVQESMKGFPNGIPAIAMPFMMNTGMETMDFFAGEDADVLNPNEQEFKKGGDVTKRVRISKMYKDGGEVPESQRPKGIPKEAKVWDAASPEFKRENVKAGDYVMTNGRLSRVQRGAIKPKGDIDTRLGNNAVAYTYLEDELRNNPKLQDALYSKYESNIKNSSLPSDTKKRLLAGGKEFAINAYLKAQKHNYALGDKGYIGSYDPATKTYKAHDEEKIANWDRFNKGRNAAYFDAAEKIGFKKDELLTDDEIAAFQGLYKSGWDAQKNDEYKDAFKNFELTPLGVKDKHGRHTYDENPISPEDRVFGNTSAGQSSYVKNMEGDLEEVPVDIPEDKAVETPDFVPEGLDEEYRSVNAPWWAQDIVNIAGAAADLGRVKKFTPWMATPEVALPDPTFLDPTRQLAANMEAANQAQQAAAAFAGPNAFNARSNQIQAQAAGNAADILGNIHNQNVQIANNFELARNQIMNQAMGNKSALATELYDRNTIANQNFENEKNAARANLRQAYIQGLTNRAQSQSLNSLYQDYQHDPSSGGFTFYTPQNDELTPTKPNDSDLAKSFLKLKGQLPNVSDEVIMKLLQGGK